MSNKVGSLEAGTVQYVYKEVYDSVVQERDFLRTVYEESQAIRGAMSDKLDECLAENKRLKAELEEWEDWSRGALK